MKIKKLVCAALSAVMMCAAMPVVAGNMATDVRFSVNDVEIGGDQKPVIINNVTYLPLRIMFNSVQAKFEWDAENKSITAKKGNTTLKMWVNKQEYRLNGKEKYMDNVPVILNGSTYVPVRLVAESFSLKIDWDAKERMVKVKDSSIKSFSADVPIITTTEATTTTVETTTETTTIDPNMSIVPGVSKKLFSLVISDVSKANTSYTLGSLDKNERLNELGKNRVMKGWEKLAETKEEKDFVNTAKGYYNAIISAYKKMENTANYKGYSDIRALAREYLDKIRMNIATFGNITSTKDINTKRDELSKSYRGIDDDIKYIKDSVEEKK